VGIGLSLVARFAQLHGGRAWCEEREGGGARFRVSLHSVPGPAAEQSQPGPADDPPVPQPTPPAEPSRAHGKGPRSLARTTSRRRTGRR
jgi:hypothetical protein